ncbi:pentatricopeptide repeat-containing protein At3g61520, mitochondrial [Diospyros lotus]|uniref:pentatricopeptide repeat-containing protein At3g61520, mitochondrial n=1 Tax=Diospyros lotus TaxID=55363 RepID=UPI00225548E1|nr:pentatricopeptide repeat-containing protein At3g61520, mitochondrial [Diospyros lotus]
MRGKLAASSSRSSNLALLLNPKTRTNHQSPSLLRRLSAEATHPTPPEPQPPNFSTLTTQVISLLQTHDNDWGNNDELRRLLFCSSDSTRSPPFLYKITHSLGTASKALNFFHFLRTNSPSPPDPLSLSYVFQAIFQLASYEQRNSHSELSKLLSISQEHGVPLTVNSATLLVRFFNRAGMIENSLLVYKELDTDKRNTNISNAMLLSLLRVGRTDYAFQLLDEMLVQDAKYPPNDNTVDIVMAALLCRDRNGKSVSDTKIVGLVKKFCEHGAFPSAVRLTQLITKLGRSGENDLAWDALHDVLNSGGNVEASSCNALLTVLARQQHFQKVNKLLAEMKENGIQPNVITFGILINHLCKFHRVDEALEVFEKMIGGGEAGDFSVKPDSIIYNTLIDGLCKVGRQGEGLQLMERMRLHQNVSPNPVTYNCLINGFCKAGEIEKALDLFEQMNEEGVPSNVITLNTLVDGMCKYGRVSRAMDFFRKMAEKGLKGNAVTYTTLINAFCNANNIDKAMGLFNEMSETECSPDAIVYYTLISGLTQSGRMDDACFVASLAKKAGFCLDTVSYNTMIGGFCRKNKLDKAYDMLKEMEQAGVKPDCVTYNTLISYFSKAGDLLTAHRMMKNMVRDGLVPTVGTHGALIHAHCLAGNLDKAMEIFWDMSSGLKITPNTVIYNMLIDSFCKNKKVEVAMSLMDDMKVKGVRPNTTTYNAMLKGLQEMNWLEKAFELMDQMTETACSPDYITMEILTNWLSAVGETEKLRRFVQGYQVSASAA